MKVLIRPLNIECEVRPDETLLQALKRQGHFLKSSCGGCASCGDCVVVIESGADHLSPMEHSEIKLLGNVFHLTSERLACQTKLTGNVTIDIGSHMDTIKLQQQAANQGKKPKLVKRKAQDRILETNEANSESGASRADKPNDSEKRFNKKRNTLKEGHIRPKKFDYNSETEKADNPDPRLADEHSEKDQ
jgi:ferredoxin